MEFLEFWTRETMANIRRNRLMSLLAISTVTIALFILGAFYLTISNLRAAVGQQVQRIELVAILDKGIKSDRRQQIFSAARIPQVASVNIELASQVLKDMKKTYSDLPLDDYMSANDNPLGDELHVQLKNPDDFFKVRTYLASIKGVSAMKDTGADAATQNLLGFNRALMWTAVISLLVLGLAILLIIHNAIRLTVFARRREIRIMQLVGATPAFIRVPFLMEGLFYGLAGSVLAAVALGLLYGVGLQGAGPLLRSVLPLTTGQVLGPCSLLMLFAGLLFGFLGALFSFSHSQRGVSA